MSEMVDTTVITRHNQGVETFKIPVRNLGALEEAVAKLAKAAAKLGAAAPTFTIVDRYERTFHHEILGELKEKMATVAVSHVTPIKDGFQFVATIEHHQTDEGHYANIVRVAPSYRDVVVGPRFTDFATAQPYCAHCDKRRDRKVTYMWEEVDTGDMIQVGATCMKDFTGHNLSLSFLSDLDAFGETFSTGGGGDTRPLLQVLTLTALIISAYGWKSSAAAREYGGQATVDKVRLAQNFRETASYQEILTAASITKDEAIAQATAAVEWILAMTDEDLAGNGYLTNLRNAVAAELTDWKNLALVVSLLPAKTKAEQSETLAATRAAEREAEVTAPVPFGKVTVSGFIISYDTREAYDGGVREVITVKDDRGFKVWGTCPAKLAKPFEELVGKRVTFTADLTQSDRDETFGFFKRPTQAAFIA